MQTQANDKLARFLGCQVGEIYILSLFWGKQYVLCPQLSQSFPSAKGTTAAASVRPVHTAILVITYIFVGSGSFVPILLCLCLMEIYTLYLIMVHLEWLHHILYCLCSEQQSKLTEVVFFPVRFILIQMCQLLLMQTVKAHVRFTCNSKRIHYMSHFTK